MHRPRLLFALLLLTLPVGCALQQASSAPPTQTRTPTIARPAALPTEYALQYRRIEIAESLPPGANLPGALALGAPGDTASRILNFARNEERDLSRGQILTSTSPDGKWLAYRRTAADTSTGTSMVIQSTDGSEVYEIRPETAWRSPAHYWLDNQRLVFELWKPQSAFGLVEIVNPFTGERQELVTDYPGLGSAEGGPIGTDLDFIDRTVIYHPSLNLVIYHRTEQTGWSVVLWDRQAQQAVLSIRDFGFWNRPVWSPDGNQFAMAVLPLAEYKTNSIYIEIREELFIGSLAGQVQQLTHFGGLFEYVELGMVSWSPDGRYLAFGMGTIPDPCGGEREPAPAQFLTLLDMETDQVVQYCIPVDGWIEPVWSPDGKHVAVAGFHTGLYLPILISVEEDWAALFEKDCFPVGWLEAP